MTDSNQNSYHSCDIARRRGALGRRVCAFTGRFEGIDAPETTARRRLDADRAGRTAGEPGRGTAGDYFTVSRTTSGGRPFQAGHRRGVCITSKTMSDKTGPHRPRAPTTQPPEVRAETLFGGAREVRIHNAGEIYRLQLTAAGKLLLTK